MGGGVFLISCKNASDSGGGGGGGGSGSDSRGLSSSNILGKTDVTITNTEKLKAVLERANFVDSSGNFTGTIPNPDTTGKKTDFAGLLLINHPNGTTEYVDVNNNTLAGNPDIEDGVQVVAVFKEPSKAIKKIKIEVEAGKQVIVPVAVSNGDPNLQEIQDALNEYGINIYLLGNSANSPKCPDPSYQYKGVAKASDAKTWIDAADTNTTISESDKLYPVFQKTVSSQVDIGNGPVPVQNTATYGDPATQEITVADLLKAANGGTPLANDPSPADPNTQKFAGWTVTKPDGTTEIVTNTSTKIPLGSTVAPSFIPKGQVVFNIKNILGESDTITFNIAGANATGSEIKGAISAKREAKLPTTAGQVPGYAGVEFVDYMVEGGSALVDSTTYDTTKVIVPSIKLAFTVSGAESNFTPATSNVTFTANKIEEKTLTDIIKASNNNSVPSNVIATDSSKKFAGWKVTKPGASAPTVVDNNGIGSATAPAGSTVAPNIVSKTFGNRDVPLNVEGISGAITVTATNIREDATTATWSAIKNSPAIQNQTPPAAGYTAVWQDKNSGQPVTDNTPVNFTGDSGLKLIWQKTLNYSIYYGGTGTTPATTSFTVTYPESGKKLNEIFAQAKVDTGTTHVAGNFEVKKPGYDFKGWEVTGRTDKLLTSEVDLNTKAGASLPTYLDGTTITACFEQSLVTNLSYVNDDGNNVDASITETKVTAISMKTFLMANTEVSRAQWKAVMWKDDNNGRRTVDPDPRVNNNKTRWQRVTEGREPTNDNMPMTNVTWYEAVEFCNRLTFIATGSYASACYTLEINGSAEADPDKWIAAYGRPEARMDGNVTGKYDHVIPPGALWGNWDNIRVDSSKTGFRLPTKDEWKYAAHGGEGAPFPKYSGTTYNGNNNSNELGKVAWFADNSGNKPHPVGEKGGDNPIRDILGNVWEWTDTESTSGHRWAMGGAFNAALNQCEIEAAAAHNGGQPLEKESQGFGFRVIQTAK